jgi:hypothetical protein
MAEIKEFVVNDRRKFTPEGEARPDAPPSEPKPARPEASLEPTSDQKFGSSAHLVDNKPKQQAPTPTPTAAEAPAPAGSAEGDDQTAPPPLTAEQTSQASKAYDATVDRIDTAIRANNPGMERLPEMSFERVIQSLYMQAMLQLGLMAPPDQKPQVDILSARQTIDMLAVLAEKTKGNLTPDEATLMDNALFELRMGFLEMTQILARQAQQAQSKQTPTPGSGVPSIVR